MNGLPVFHTHFSELHVYIRLPTPRLPLQTISSTALRSEYRLNSRNGISNNTEFKFYV